MQATYYHFSVDDVLDSLLSLRTATHSLTECETISFLRELHDQFDARVDLYTFLRQPANGESLTDLPATLQPLFAQQAWLKLGPHALDRDTPPHSQSIDQQALFLEQTYQQILRFAGADCVSPWVRLHYFSECFEQTDLLRQFGTRGLFTTDKPAISYRLPAPELEQLRTRGRTNYYGLEFIRSHVRIENLAGRILTDRALGAELDVAVGNAECVVIFTHEYELERPEVRDMAKRVFRWIGQNNLRPCL